MPNQVRDARGRFASKDNGAARQGLLQQWIVLNQMIGNTVQFSRRQWANFNAEGDWRRNINHECGYPETDQLEAVDYKRLIDREPVAARVNEILPKECWKVHPTVHETEDAERETEFERAWDKLASSLAGESYYAEEEGGQIWNYLERADILSGIGRYGVLLLGLGDGKPLSEPVEPREGLELMYMRPYSQTNIIIQSKDEDRTSRRFGHPVIYNLSATNQDDVNVGNVHWTRVIHLADNCESSDTLATPRLQRLYNRMYDLRKILGGSAEMFWQAGFPGYSYELPTGLSPKDVILGTTVSDMKDKIEQAMNSLQRYELNLGLEKKSLTQQVADPSSHIDWQITCACILLACPKRIFMGSERGELASTQDTRFWNSQLVYRQSRYITPRVVVPLVNRLIILGVLPKPAQGFRVSWPELETLTAKDMAEMGLTKTKSVTEFVRGDGISMMTAMDFWTRIIGLTEDEALAVVNAKKQEAEDEFKEDGYDEDQGYEEEEPDGEEYGEQTD